MMHVLVVTHLFGCVEIDNSFVSFLARRRLNLGLVATPETPGFPSKVHLPSTTIRSQLPVSR